MDSLLKLRNGQLFREPTWTSKAVEIRSIYRDANDRMWVATDGNGLFLYEGDKVTVFTTRDGLASNNLRNILRDRQGAIWIATFGSGVTRYAEGRFTTYTTADGLGSNWVVTLYEARDGSLWLSTRGGLSRYANGRFFTFRAQDGLPVNFVTAIIEDDQGNFWFSCDQGIFRVKKTDFDEFSAGKIPRLAPVLYGPEDGLLSTGFLAGQQSVSFRAADGRLLFPSLKGLVVVDPAHLTSNTVIPPVQIERVTIDKRPVRLGPAIEIAPGEGEVEIHYTALSFVAAARMQFRYRLEGFDREWVDAGTRRFAYYANLPPGRYTFQVIASNNDGVWNRTGAVVAFRLQPHFYETAWWWGVLAIGLGLGVLGFYRVRTATLRRRNELLERHVAERTVALAERSTQLAKSYEELKQTQQELVETSRKAGMAEVATGVLHNIGNALNSVNTSATLAGERARNLKLPGIGRVAQLLSEQGDRLGEFFATDPRGQQLPVYLAQLAEHLQTERNELVGEIDSLQASTDQIKQIVAAQQSYARVSGIVEIVPPVELVEFALHSNEATFSRHGIKVVREFSPAPAVKVERHQVLQILLNLIRNAKEAVEESRRPDQQLVLGVRTSPEGRVQIYVTDNGVGIAPENLTRMFSFGFTTKVNGHGFGLHTSANAAKEMGGSLQAQSDGPGRGATLVLELPPAG
jgi:signal transduction histidine kinase